MAVVVEDQRGTGRWIGKNGKSIVEQLVDVQDGHRARESSLGSEDRTRRDNDHVGLPVKDPVCVGINAQPDLGARGLCVIAQPVDVSIPTFTPGPPGSQTTASAMSGSTFRPATSVGTPTSSRNRIARSLKTPLGSLSPGTKKPVVRRVAPVPPLTLKRSTAPVEATLRAISIMSSGPRPPVR